MRKNKKPWMNFSTDTRRNNRAFSLMDAPNLRKLEVLSWQKVTVQFM